MTDAVSSSNNTEFVEDGGDATLINQVTADFMILLSMKFLGNKRCSIERIFFSRDFRTTSSRPAFKIQLGPKEGK